MLLWWDASTSSQNRRCDASSTSARPTSTAFGQPGASFGRGQLQGDLLPRARPMRAALAPSLVVTLLRLPRDRVAHVRRICSSQVRWPRGARRHHGFSRRDGRGGRRPRRRSARVFLHALDGLHAPLGACAQLSLRGVVVAVVSVTFVGDFTIGVFCARGALLSRVSRVTCRCEAHSSSAEVTKRTTEVKL